MSQGAGLTLESVRDAVEAAGLALRGAFAVGPEDEVPNVAGQAARTLVLTGNAGRRMWTAFRASGYLDGRPDPLDDWSRATLEALAERFEARALFPFGGPPFRPFIRWAQRAESLTPSVMGPLIHPRYGLWHAYRGALAFREDLSLAEVPTAELDESPCAACVERACLTHCPVGAMREGHYDVPTCVGFLATPMPSREAEDCLARGCQARRACPVGAQYRYEPEQASHHMRVFVRNARQP